MVGMSIQRKNLRCRVDQVWSELNAGFPGWRYDASGTGVIEPPSLSNVSGKKRLLGWMCRSLQCAALCISFSLFCNAAGAGEQGVWQDQSSEADTAKVVRLLKTYGVVPIRVSAMRFSGLREAIGDVILFRASNVPDCVQQHSCWYVLLSSDSPDAPIVTTCEFQRGSLAHHFHEDRSNFFVFDFSCSGAPMQIQLSKGHFFVAADPKR